MIDEQMNLDLHAVETTFQDTEETSCYDLLDYQLADLFEELANKQGSRNNQCLRECTLEVSKQTREGRIASICNSEQQIQLLSTKLVTKVTEQNTLSDNQPLILDQQGYLYLRRYWLYQQKIANQLHLRMEQENQRELHHTWQEQRLAYYFKNDSKENEINWQKLAAERALQNKFLIISGGPGTGKTTTITRILALLIEEHLEIQKHVKIGGGGYHYQEEKLKILLAAPTGKASIRMLDSIREAQQKMQLSEKVQQCIPTKASTLHKLLGFIPDSIAFKHKPLNPLNADIVLVDEASMIDIAMMSKLIESIPASAKLILIGDKDQLSSVETGSVFTDMCHALENTNYMITLKKNWRFSKDSGIGKLAIAANNGDVESLKNVLNQQKFQECELLSPNLLSAKLIPEVLFRAWERYFDALNHTEASLEEIFNAFNHYRILCALRQGPNGSKKLSQRIEKTLARQGLIQSGTKWYHGRPVMITQNSYGKKLFNGDTGITLIKNGQAKVYFPDSGEGEEGSYKSFSPIRLPAHETTWAMTIHKSQGSEFAQVALILPHEIMPLLTRQLIYTGITRAKNKVLIVSRESVLLSGVTTEVVSATRIESVL